MNILTCLRIAYFLFELVALKNTKVQGDSSPYDIVYHLGRARQSSRLKPHGGETLLITAPSDPWSHASTHRILRLSRFRRNEIRCGYYCCDTFVSRIINVRHPRDFTSHTSRRRTLHIYIYFSHLSGLSSMGMGWVELDKCG